jgi:hypothetical protein
MSFAIRQRTNFDKLLQKLTETILERFDTKVLNCAEQA